MCTYIQNFGHETYNDMVMCVGQDIIYDAYSPKKFKIRIIILVSSSCHFGSCKRFVFSRIRHALITQYIGDKTEKN